MTWKERYQQRILRKYGDTITGLVDMTGNASPSFLFSFMAERMAYLLSGDPLRMLSPRKVSFHRRLNPLIKRMGRLFLGHKQEFENGSLLLGADELDEPTTLPKEPVIWCANHGFKEDVLATVLAFFDH